MGHDGNRVIGYCSRVVGGLVACAVVAVTLHAHVAAVAMLTAVMLVVVGMTPAALRHHGR